MKCTRPRPLKPWKSIYNSGNQVSPTIYVDCGKCLNCKINKAREWTTRLIHETNISQSTIFITLTYDTEHLPSEGVRKSDVQDFISDLRKVCGPGIRYFIGSEYGDSSDGTHRPHYHGFIFNAPDWLKDTPCSGADRVETRLGKANSRSFVNTYYNDIWRRGFVTVGEFHPRRAGYLAHYYVDKADAPQGMSSNFSLMSKRPGIGADFYAAVSDKVIAGKPIITHLGTALAVPRYYRRLRSRLTGESFDPYDLEGISRINESKKLRVDLAEILEVNSQRQEHLTSKSKQI